MVVFDEHEESLQEERTPTWHARDVALERARWKGVPAVLASPTPSLEALRAGRLLRPGRTAEREGWPVVDVLDRRDDDPVKAGPFAERLGERLAEGRVICVLNRKGRSRLLACAACGELVRSEDGTSAMILIEDRLEVEARVVVLGHVQRGGSPTAFDRILATRYGVSAMDTVLEEDFGKMVALRAGRIVRVPLEEATREARRVDPELYATASVFFG